MEKISKNYIPVTSIIYLLSLLFYEICIHYCTLVRFILYLIHPKRHQKDFNVFYMYRTYYLWNKDNLLKVVDILILISSSSCLK